MAAKRGSSWLTKTGRKGGRIPRARVVSNTQSRLEFNRRGLPVIHIAALIDEIKKVKAGK
jgi:hypothetical protein